MPLSPASQPTVLLIDDSVVELRLLVELMSARGMRALVALSGQDGYDKAVRQRPGLILLDLMMPDLDGFAVCRMLKEHHATRNIPVIFLSCAGELDNRLTGLSLGGVDFIGKPFSEAEVIAKVEIHLDIARQINAARPAADAGSACSAPYGRAARNADLVELATGCLLSEIRDPPSLEELACRIGTNEKRLGEAFQERYGLTVFGWLREERLRQARRWLLASEMPVGHIAEQLGYASPSHFTRAFRERFGISPRGLRKQEDEGEDEAE